MTTEDARNHADQLNNHNAQGEMINGAAARAEVQLGQETAVGISAYVCPGAHAFTCTIKQRYTDFLVNEISTNGRVLHLTNLSVTGTGKGRKRHHDESTAADLEPVDPSTLSAGDVDRIENGHEETGGDGGQSPHKKQRIIKAGGSLAADDTDVTNVELQADEDKTKKERQAEITNAFPEADKLTLTTVFGVGVTDRILGLHADTMLNPGRKPREHATVMSEPITEKSKRTEAHVAVRKIFAGRLETATLQDQPGIISIKAASTKAPQGARGQLAVEGAIQKGKLGWSDLGGEYLHFTLYKENKDTMEALHYIATQLKVRVSIFQFAGTKDRRGVTAQRVAIFRVRAEQVAKLNTQARGWRVGDFSYEKHGLDLGESNGNEFLLTLRDCHFDKEQGLNPVDRLNLARSVIKQAGESFQQGGFLNYYGLQRFGTYSIGTHLIGQQMLQGDLKGAIDCILTYDPELLSEKQTPDSSVKVPQDDIARADTIKQWRESGVYHSKDKTMPKRFQAESSIMEYLSKKDRKTGKFLQDQDWQGALTTIQRNLRLMYVHGYQSFVWNAAVGKRWEMHGDKVVEGDLVIVGEKDSDGAVKPATVDDDGEPIFHPAAHDTAQAGDDVFTRARPLSKAEVDSGKYDIFDVVLPLPGYDVEYPSNAIGKFYEDFMGSEAGGNLDPHRMRRTWKDLSLSGAYRKVMSRPGPCFGMEVREYQSDDEQMVETDLERLQKAGQANGDLRQRPAQASGGDGGGPGGDTTAQTRIAVVLRMQLGSSQYATMALRELTKGGAINYKPDYSAR